MAHSFKVGDIVKLKSGSPRMTVRTPRTMSDTVGVVWFGRDGRPHEDNFPPDALMRVGRKP